MNIKTIDDMIRQLRIRGAAKWPCPHYGKDGCEAKPFDTHQARNNHIRNFHIGRPLPKMNRQEANAWKRAKQAQSRKAKKEKKREYRFPSDNPEYRKRKYDERKALRKQKLSKSEKLSASMKESWVRRRAQLEGLTQVPNSKIKPTVYHAPFEVPIKECPHCKRAFPAGVIWRESE